MVLVRWKGPTGSILTRRPISEAQARTLIVSRLPINFGITTLLQHLKTRSCPSKNCLYFQANLPCLFVLEDSWFASKSNGKFLLLSYFEDFDRSTSSNVQLNYQFIHKYPPAQFFFFFFFCFFPFFLMLKKNKKVRINKVRRLPNLSSYSKDKEMSISQQFSRSRIPLQGDELGFR